MEEWQHANYSSTDAVRHQTEMAETNHIRESSSAKQVSAE
jgi:hypothetical protein